MLEYYEASTDKSVTPHIWESNDCGCPPHFHSGIELVLLLEGSISGSVNGQQFIVKPGELLIMNPYAVHDYHSTPVKAIVLLIPLASIPSGSQKKLEDKHFADLLTPDDAAHTIERLMRMMIEYKDHTGMQHGLSHALVSYLVDTVGLLEAAAPGTDSFLRDVLTWLSEHYREPISVEQLAMRFQYSSQRFLALFKENIGSTLAQYVGGLRVGYAADQLTHTDHTLTETAAEAGFSSVKAMELSFKEVYGCTAAEYVRQHRKPDSI